MKIHHVGYLVKDVVKANEKMKVLGFIEKSDIIYDEFRKINILFIENDGYTIELVAPASDDSVVAGLYKKYRNTPYHICYTTSNLKDEMEKLIQKGFVQIDNPCIAPAINNKKTVFFMSSVLGMIELVED